VIERHGAGIVSRGDTAEELADALVRVLADEELARRLGAAARQAAERQYDWAVIGERLATTILERESRAIGTS
jgi:glycosyltransferase involved in cell wall biosynthesis